MNKLTTAKRVGIRATARLADVTKGAVSKLLADIGTVCASITP